MGSATVLINNLPAARQGDLITESGPPNSITMGEPTVLIG
ncbi:MAG: PAAR domain-containing protein [Desulfotomaculaceae bacterium]|nr:PAAR domain-containing protein [Desulfotomaculaceae bacterium]